MSLPFFPLWPCIGADVQEERGETFMMFGYPKGVQGNVVNAGTNELIIPNYKQTWGDIREIADAPRNVAHLSFKSQEYRSA